MESPDQDNDVTTTTPTTNHNNNNNNNHSKPGRKFGLVGQRTNSTPPNSPAVVDDPSRRMSVREDQKHSWMYSLSEQEMEDKFNAICLSIRTENLTLGQRLEHQLAERDLVEANLNQEMRGLHALFLVLKQEVARNQSSKSIITLEGTSTTATANNNTSSVSNVFSDIFNQLSSQVEAVHNCALRISSSAESLGAVEYESRLSAAVQILLLYVDNVKRKWEKEHHELEETKRILKESGVNVAQCLANLPSGSAEIPANKRRASFPAAPFRRISLKSAHPSVSKASTEEVSAQPIQEEDAEAPDVSTLPAEDQAPPPPPPLPPPINPHPPVMSRQGSTDKAGVTIRRRGKRRSWGSRSGSLTSTDGHNLYPNGRNSQHQQRKLSWASQAGEWTRQTVDQILTAGSTARDQWESLRRKKLQLLRYSASACFLVAALVSLFFTFFR